MLCLLDKKRNDITNIIAFGPWADSESSSGSTDALPQTPII